MLSLRSVWQRNFYPSLTVLWELLRDGLQFLNVVARSRTAVAAEIVFLRKQLAYYQDHQIRPRRLNRRGTIVPCCHVEAFGSVTSAPALLSSVNCCGMDCSSRTSWSAPEQP